ncbi:hypothetical protein Cni_G07918 [Canna indica]|uniref:BSD domain-containing protein n=1 Tax=Canna indica TaxID=4628 RepID=A0AAQ3K2Y1_9LILI|nr:hypothetical protein Cni_G07918 [Canna indica]
MAWLARSLRNSLVPDHGSSDGDVDAAAAAAPSTRKPLESDDGTGEEESDDPSRGVKEDLSELSQTLARQFWGVASFLAPPPNSSDGRPPDPAVVHRDAGPTEASDAAAMAGIRSDFEEIRGRFRSGISKISGNMGVSEISKIASNFLPFGAEEEEEDDEDDGNFGADAIGITDEVMSFVHNISMHPETWLDFPLLSDDEDSDDFDMSDAQIEHAYTVECLSPRLAALRIELCPSHMSEGCFWKTYFVLLHPRLNKHDAELLSTPQVVEARALLLQKLQNQPKLDSPRVVNVSRRNSAETSFLPIKQDTTSKGTPYETQHTVNLDTEKNPVQATANMEAIDKSNIEKGPPKAPLKELSFVSNNSFERLDEDEEDEDAWLEDDTEDLGGFGSMTIPIDNEDVSFSDLEEEDERDAPKAPQR